MVEVGTWKSFDDIEEHLILDELLLLTDELHKKRRHEFRMVALAAGADIEDDEDEDHQINGELPPEVLEAERAFKAERERKRQEALAEGQMQSFADGLGYEVVS